MLGWFNLGLRSSMHQYAHTHMHIEYQICLVHEVIQRRNWYHFVFISLSYFDVLIYLYQIYFFERTLFTAIYDMHPLFLLDTNLELGPALAQIPCILFPDFWHLAVLSTYLGVWFYQDRGLKTWERNKV